MIVAAVPFPHSHVWAAVVHCDIKSVIIAITAMKKLTSYTGLMERNCVRIVRWRDWRL